MLRKHQKMLQCLRARFLRGKVAPLAPTESGREDAAAVPPTLVVAAYLGGKKGPNQELAFLRAVRRVCEACKGKGLRTLPFSKQAVGEEILDIMEEAFFNLTEPFVEAMATVQKLSQFQPPLGPDLRSSIVAWAVRLIVSGSPGPHQPHQLELQDRAEKGLREMLEQLLREDPSAGHVVGLLEHLAYWLQTSCPTARSRAASLSSCLLQFAGRLPSFPIRDSAALGNLLDTGIREQARGTLGQLHRLLQCRRGLRKKTRGPRWEVDPGQPWKEGFLHLRHVGEVFLGHLTPQQKEAFAQAAWGNLSHLAQDWVREGSLVLLYSVLGRADQLLEEKEEDDLRMSLSALTSQLWKEQGGSEVRSRHPARRLVRPQFPQKCGSLEPSKEPRVLKLHNEARPRSPQLAPKSPESPYSAQI
ncbi:uncharacterized protein LOC125435561 [Sphaerodactylus townsendi]|uniref:uncharacterized protein LOC125435561 n=1 Tax=Sphaerodactylus townsendi TaxID=933632 RepID=UPI0020270D1C|nr:uncharacterized protein LOC125435561 [Sphaerodactylus townsendi]